MCLAWCGLPKKSLASNLPSQILNPIVTRPDHFDDIWILNFIWVWGLPFYDKNVVLPKPNMLYVLSTPTYEFDIMIVS